MPAAAEARGAREVLGTLAELANRLEHLQPGLEQVRDEVILPHLAEVFSSQGGATKGGGWAPLSAEYALQKARDGYSDTILQRTGELMRSMTSAASSTVTDEELVIRSEVQTKDGGWYLGSLHQDGTRRGLPVRAIVDPPDSVVQRTAEVLTAYIEGR